jgi:hypothetical protein
VSPGWTRLPTASSWAATRARCTSSRFEHLEQRLVREATWRGRRLSPYVQ